MASTGDSEAISEPTQPLQNQPEPQDNSQTVQTSTSQGENGEPAAPMSKNALKRLRKVQEWENGREDRKKRRREKRHATKARRREEREELIAQGADPAVLFAKKLPAQRVPIALILDCGFEDYMTEREKVSLSSQVTRCYSDNRNFKYKSHLWISGWGGKLKERFETALENQHMNWKGVGFEEGNFLAAAVRAREKMVVDGGEMIDALKRSADNKVKWERDEKVSFPIPDPIPELNEDYKDVVYLTSESPYTLERLEPNTSYVIGGLVDKNREKGLCYKRAVEMGIRTAKLPIGQYLMLRSRQILTTNHVVEIMVRWLECESWAEAFMHVIPKRKGATVREDEDDGEGEDEGDEEKEGGDKNENEIAKEDSAGLEAEVQLEEATGEQGQK